MSVGVLYVCVLLSISDVFFFVLELSLSTVQLFFILMITGSGDIVHVVLTVQIDLQKFRLTAPGSNLAFVLKNIAHNFYKMQKGHVIVKGFNFAVSKFRGFLNEDLSRWF